MILLIRRNKGFIVLKKTVIRSSKHLKFIRTLECAMCDSFYVEAAHLRMRTNGGMGMKPSDSCVIPLCTAHHRMQHHIGEELFWTGRNPHDLAESLWQATGNRDLALAIILEQRHD